jgi:hypothetical protein
MNRRKFLQIVPAAVLSHFLLRQENNLAGLSAADPDESICAKKFELAVSLDLQQKPIGGAVVAMARSFLGTDYAANTIEAAGKEHLVVNLQTLDCVTFYENSLVLARCIKKNSLTFEAYKKELQFVRYRNGIIDGYPSRLHYTSDYFYDNEQKGVLEDITEKIGGVPFDKKIYFMSAHPELYPRLKETPAFAAAMQKIEDEINARKRYHIPKGKVRKISSYIKDGDIIGITTNIEGLDCSHTGIAVWQNKKLHFMHAPSPGKKVQITDLPLWDYLAHIKKDAGIIAARPLEPKL